MGDKQYSRLLLPLRDVSEVPTKERRELLLEPAPNTLAGGHVTREGATTGTINSRIRFEAADEVRLLLR